MVSDRTFIFYIDKQTNNPVKILSVASTNYDFERDSTLEMHDFYSINECGKI
jgi:hypothetical protein